MIKRYGFLILLVLACVFRCFSYCGSNDCSEVHFGEGISDLEFFTKLREHCIEVARKYFPSPHSELLLGVTIGVDKLKDLPSFNNALKDSGTIHVVVVSGFNISLVFSLVLKVIGSRYKTRNLIIAQIVTLFYSLLSGFEPPVIRSYVMGSIVSWGKYCGRSLEAMYVLIFSGLVMILLDPAYLFSLSFQLSFMATLGLIVYSSFFEKILKSKFFLFEDLSSTLSAQVLVWPIISFAFGRFSILSPLVNMLILWTIPISTILGGLFLLVSFINVFLAKIVALPLYVFLDIFITVVEFFAKIPFVSIDLEISLILMITYYLVLFILFMKSKHK